MGRVRCHQLPPQHTTSTSPHTHTHTPASTFETWISILNGCMDTEGQQGILTGLQRMQDYTYAAQFQHLCIMQKKKCRFPIIFKSYQQKGHGIKLTRWPRLDSYRVIIHEFSGDHTLYTVNNFQRLARSDAETTRIFRFSAF